MSAVSSLVFTLGQSHAQWKTQQRISTEPNTFFFLFSVIEDKMSKTYLEKDRPFPIFQLENGVLSFSGKLIRY